MSGAGGTGPEALPCGTAGAGGTNPETLPCGTAGAGGTNPETLPCGTAGADGAAGQPCNANANEHDSAPHPNAKLWGGRFTAATDSFVNDFQSSIRFDARMYRQDIEGSAAHAAMLARQGIIGEGDANALREELASIRADIDAGLVSFDVAAEDIHMNIETLLTERIANKRSSHVQEAMPAASPPQPTALAAGQPTALASEQPTVLATGQPSAAKPLQPAASEFANAGKKLHTARSRNDQVALDLRMYLMEETHGLCTLACSLVECLLGLAEKHAADPMPGYTHLQRAQPVTFGHHMMAYAEMFLRDAGRLLDCHARMDSMPLGAGALAGVTYPIDRSFVATLLGFSRVTNNSLDAVSDRDFALELMSAIAIAMTHLSRGAEELALWSSQEFGFVELSDEHSTGSSIMPQKKNPDAAELVRGKAGRAIGNLVSLLVTMKGLPLAYNKDMQEDKEAVFDSVDTAKACIGAYIRMLGGMRVDTNAMRRAALGGFANATDLADYLVRKGLPFRQAHEAAGKLVRRCIDRRIALEGLTVAEMQETCALVGDDIYDAISLEACIAARDVTGGPAPSAMEAAIGDARARLAEARNRTASLPRQTAGRTTRTPQTRA